MDKSSAVLFDYSKAAGLLKKSFVKDRVIQLFQQNSLSEIWALIFKTPAPLVPEVMLAKEIEKQALSNFLKQYEFFLKQFDNPSVILKNQFRVYEIENLEEIIDALCSAEKELPELIDLHGHSVLKTEKWPDIAKITEGTEYQWINRIPDIHDQQKISFKLDLQLVQETWKAIQQCKGENKLAHEKLFLDEYVIKNIIWALRLSIFYGMTKEQVIENLFYVGEKASKNDPLAGPAIKVLSFNPEKYSEWEKWEFRKYLNPHIDGDTWKVDPSWIEKSSMLDQEKHAYAIFHQYSMEDVALVAWFKIKVYELSCIRTAVEALRLNVGSQEAMSILGINSLE